MLDMMGAMTEENAPLFSIVDPRPIAESAPYTFFLPSAAEIAAVSRGDLVKLIFAYPREAEEWAAERMWVIVDEVDGDELTGVLDNDPSEPTTSLAAGAMLRFLRDNIISIMWAEPETASPPAVHRDYWDHCLVDDCVVDGSEPVEYIYREEPDMEEEGDTFRDSGWRIRGRVGEATDDELEARMPQYVPLGMVLNQDDSWLDLIDAPIGARFFRNFQTNVYERQG